MITTTLLEGCQEINSYHMYAQKNFKNQIPKKTRYTTPLTWNPPDLFKHYHKQHLRPGTMMNITALHAKFRSFIALSL